ncbi:MAG TPA: Ig domain-containing protein [Solirubrobacterales bacterium]
MIAGASSGETVDFDASLEGETIVLTSGAINVDKSLTIDGPGASELTIDGDHAGQILAVTAGNLSISGLSFVNAAGPENGGAIAQTGTGSLSVSNCAFTGNTAGGAGGADDYSNLGHGGAIYVSESSGPTFVSDSFFSGNSAGGAGGAGFQSGLGSGGAIWDRGESLAVSDSTFIANTAGGVGGAGMQSGVGAGGAIQKAGGLSLTVTGSEFTANTAGGNGGGEEASGRGHGGAVYVSRPEEEAPSLTIVDSSFTDNAAGADGGDGKISGMGEGGAVEHYSAGPLSVSDATFEGNSAGGAGGAGGVGFIFGPATGSGGGLGGAIFVDQLASSTSVTDSVFTGNTAGGDGGNGGLSGRGEGGAFKGHSATGPVTIARSTFTENIAGGRDGGGSGSGAAVGGAINSFSALTVTDSTFTDNAAAGQGGDGEGAFGFGGAISNHNNVSPLIVSGSTFTGNTAGGQGEPGAGGAIRAGSVSARPASISNSTFVGNAAGGGGAAGEGGAIEVDGAVTATLTGVTIDENEVGAGGAGAGIVGAGDVIAKATIVSGNTGATNCDAPVISSTHSLEGPSAGDVSCGFNLSSANPLLEPLADNGGPTETQALAAGSPAFDAVPAAKCPTKVDQRGEPRPGLGEKLCDIGAFEFQAPPVAPSITSAATATFKAGEAGGFTVAATGLPAPALSVAGVLPSGVSLVDNGDGTASLSGTPAPGDDGSYPITIKASNGTAPDAEQGFVLTVQAPPPIPAHKLTVGLLGEGAGTVTTTGRAISCPPACSQSFPAGTQVQLNADPAPGSTFAGWSGGCAGTGTCQIALAAETTLVARFEKVAPVPAQLRIRRVRPAVEGRKVKVVVAGTIAETARGIVRLTVAARVDGRRLSATGRAKIGDGRWRGRLLLAGLDADDAVKIRVGATFQGSAGVGTARVKRSAPFGY